MFTIRNNCLFCNCSLNNRYFEKDLSISCAVYNVDPNTPLTEMSIIPYNVAICDRCGTGQTVYLADLSEVYKVNHADSTGSTMKNMHIEFKNLITKYSHDIKGILEIGSSKGELADLIINDPIFTENKSVKSESVKNESVNESVMYHIIEPNFFGNTSGKHIISDFYENVDDANIPANTMIISHVYEHFYNPYDILVKISQNNNIKHFFLSFPDLEHYVKNNILHVLNTEHTYYTDNNFIVELFATKGFIMKEMEFYRGHSVFMHFVRDREQPLKEDALTIFPRNTESRLFLDNYFAKIYDSVKTYNEFFDKSESKYNYIFPCSIHSIFLITFGLNIGKLDGMLDNSPNKIDKKIYGYDLMCKSFKKVLESEDTVSIALNGGVFNSEIIPLLANKPNIRYIAC